MNTLLVSYDLHKAGQNYPGLYDELKSHDNWWNHLGSTWLIKTSLTQIQLRDKLVTLTDSNDKIMVIDVTRDPVAWSGFDESGATWIKNHF